MFLLLTVITLTGILGFSYYAYRKAFYAPTQRPTEPKPLVGAQYEASEQYIQRISQIMEKIPFEPVSITSGDGIKLYGRYYHVADGAPLEILFHGYRSFPFRDCAGGHALSRKMGFNALVVDQRAHGKSAGNTITFGIMERLDALEWVLWACDRFGHQTPIILSGLSMGAATVLMTADLDLPDNVCCIIADSPYSSPCAIIEKVAKDQHLPPLLCRPFIRLGARLFGGFDLCQASAEKAVSKTGIPILLIHGEADGFVPCEMSFRILDACTGPAQLQTFPGADHALSYITDPVRYERVVYEFLRKIPILEKAISPDFIRQLFPE